MKRRILCIFMALCFAVLPACKGEEAKEAVENEIVKDIEIKDIDIQESEEAVYVLNTKSKKIHFTDCYSAQMIKSENREYYYLDDIKFLLEKGYTTCGNCLG